MRKTPHNWKLVSLIAILFCTLSSLESRSQDIHFSQYYLSHQSTNPASVGDFDADFRLAGVHRNQWRSVTRPFSTFQIAGDARDFMGKEGLGAGLRILDDRAGDSNFSTFSVQTSLSNTLSLDPDGDLELHMGIQFGYTQQRIDYSGLRFDEQYNGYIYDHRLSSSEATGKDARGRGDVHVGMYVKKKISAGRDWSMGFSVWNLNSPDVSFIDNERVNLSQRLSLHGEMSIDLGKAWDLIPSARSMFQGPFREHLLGMRIRHTWEYSAMRKKRAFVGAFNRWNDAAYIVTGLEQDRWTIGLSYDINVSSLEIASSNRGAIEVTAVYLFDVFNEVRKPHKRCIDLL